MYTGYKINLEYTAFCMMCHLWRMKGSDF